jgi:DHA1 family bicyclomycin/chloramphenicol resistance-like MFS transporter
VTRLGVERLLRLGALVAALAGVLVAVLTATDGGGLAGLVAALFVFIAMAGLIIANSVVGALATNPRRAGAVSALIGAIQYGSGIVGSAAVGVFADGTAWPMGWVIALGGIGSAVCAWTLLPRAIAPRAEASLTGD